MGVISDTLKARLTEMQARHAETDRQLAAERAQLSQDLKDLISATDRLLACTD